jgi:adenosine deaminase
MARTGLEHAFLPGKSLWAKQDDFTRVSGACAKETIGSEKPADSCAEFLKTNEKAQQQWELEKRFRIFETNF